MSQSTAMVILKPLVIVAPNQFFFLDKLRQIGGPVLCVHTSACPPV